VQPLDLLHVRIRERTSFANANDAGDPAFVAFPSANGTPFSVTLTDPDGSRRIFVQFKDDQGDAADDLAEEAAGAAATASAAAGSTAAGLTLFRSRRAEWEQRLGPLARQRR
jgi:hypothetical protein